MYNLLEYSENYRKTTGSLWNYYRDESNSGINGGINYSIMGSKSLEYKANFIEGGVTENNLIKNDVKTVVPLTYLNNFWRSLNIPLINCEIELILTWFKNCVLISKAREANYGDNPVVHKIDNPKNAIFEIKDTGFYVPVVTLSKESDTKLLEQIKTGFKITIKQKKYRSQITFQPQNINLNYLIDPTFISVNRLFVLSFARNLEGDNRDSFSHCYVPNVEIKDFNVLIDGKSFFDLPVKNKEKLYEKNIDMSRNNDYTTVNLLDFAYFKENYQLIAIDLSKQSNLKNPQQINFIGKLENQTNGATMFFIIKKSEETALKFSQNSVTII